MGNATLYNHNKGSKDSNTVCRKLCYFTLTDDERFPRFKRFNVFFYFFSNFYCYMYGGSVTTGRQTGDQQVAGLIRGRGAAA